MVPVVPIWTAITLQPPPRPLRLRLCILVRQSCYALLDFSRYDRYGAALEPSPGDLIGSGTVGRLVPLSMAATGGAISQFFLVVGAYSAPFWGLGCAVSAGGTWLKARSSGGRGDSALPAILGGLFLGNAAGFLVGFGARGTVRLLTRRRP